MKYAVLFCAAVLVAAGPINRAEAALVAISLGEPAGAGEGIDIPVSLTFGGELGDRLDVVTLAFFETLHFGSDFSTFSFTRAPTLTGWDDAFTLGVGPALDPSTGLVFLSASDPSFDIAANTTTQLGVLHVGLNGLPVGTQFHFTLDGADPKFPTDAAGTIGDSSPTFLSDLPAGSLVTTSADFTITPEPSSLAIFGGLIVAGLARRGWRQRRRLAGS